MVVTTQAYNLQCRMGAPWGAPGIVLVAFAAAVAQIHVRPCPLEHLVDEAAHVLHAQARLAFWHHAIGILDVVAA